MGLGWGGGSARAWVCASAGKWARKWARMVWLVALALAGAPGPGHAQTVAEGSGAEFVALHGQGYGLLSRPAGSGSDRVSSDRGSTRSAEIPTAPRDRHDRHHAAPFRGW